MVEHITTETQRRRELCRGSASHWLTLPDDESTWTLTDVIACYGREVIQQPLLMRGHFLYPAILEYSERLKARKRGPLQLVSVGHVGRSEFAA